MIARYHLGDFEGAQSEREAAEKAYPERAEVHLYSGLLLLHEAESLKAASALERARALDAQAVEPMASYYAGLAWQSARDRERAEEALRRVQEQAPGTTWAEQAARALAGEDDAPAGRSWWAIVSAGFEYDDNVVLRGEGVDRPDDISDDGSPAGLWSFDSGVELWRRGDWAAGIGASYAGSAYTDFSDFDEQTPGVRGWLDHRINESLLARLGADFEYTWLDYDKYVAYYGMTGSLLADLGDWGSAYGFLRFAQASFPTTPPSFPVGPSGSPDQTRAARDRDGNEVRVGFDYWRELGPSTLVRAGYTYQYYDSDGSEYDFDSHEFTLGLRHELPWNFALDLSGSVELRPYDNPSTFEDPPGSAGSFESSDRDEQTYRFDAVIERPINRWLTGSLYYGFKDNDSNVDVFDYDRNVVGFLLTVQLSN